MNRRELLKQIPAIALLPLALKQGVGHAAKIEEGKYLLFCDSSSFDFDGFSGVWPKEWGNVDMIAVSVFLKEGQTMDDAVRLYRKEEKA